MFESQKHVFWQALLATILIFGIGLLLGYALESARTTKVANQCASSEIDIMDMRIQGDVLSIEKANCEKVIEENIKFADRIYEEAKTLEKYQTASKLSEEISLEHKRYDLLRTLIWINSINIRSSCNASYHNIIYLYKNNDPSIDERTKQSIFATFLQELKDKWGNEIMLVPIAADSGLASLNILLKTYNVTEFPTILVDEKLKVESVEDLIKVEQYLQANSFSSNNASNKTVA
ncbi:MAG: hypothetical protein QW063_02850 [Candidatus Nanoarchaeia archaeon]